MKNTNVPFNVMRHRNSWDVAPRMPEAVATWVINATGVAATSTFTIAAINVASYVAVTLVTSAVLGALAPKPDFGSASSNSGQLLSNSKNALAPAQFIYGQVRKGGTITYIESTGGDNKILHQIIVLAAHEVEEIGDIYFNDEIVTMNGDYVSTAPFAYLAKVYKHIGDQTSSASTFAGSTESLDTTLLAEPGISLTTDFVGKGLSYLYCRFTYDQDGFADGLPTVTAVVKGKKVVKTINGVDQTPVYSNNAAWCTRDFLTSSYGLYDNQINYETFEAAAAICDDTTVLSDGTPQYTMNGVISSDEGIGGVLQRMMTTCGGTLFWGSGKWRLYAGAFITPTKTLTLDDFRSGISLDTKVSMRDNFNNISGTFIDASQDYISADYPQVSGITGPGGFLAEDNGVETSLDLNLPFTTNSFAAQRIAKQMLYRSREQLTLSADFGMNAFDVEVGDFIKIRNERYGWGYDTNINSPTYGDLDGSDKIFEVNGWRLSPDSDRQDLRVNLTLRESSEAAFGFSAADERTIVSNNTTLLKYYDVPSIGISTGQVYRVVNENVVNAITVTVTSTAMERIDSVILKYRRTDAYPNPLYVSGGSEPQTITDSFTSVGKTLLIDETNTAGRFEIVGVAAPQVNDPPINYTIKVTPVNALGFKGPEETTTILVAADTLAPARPSSFSHLLSGGTIFFSWPAVSELDLSHYSMYFDSNASSTFTLGTTPKIVDKIARPATSISFPAQAGKFFITSVDKTGNESVDARSTTVLQSELPVLGTTSVLTQNSGFSGSSLTNINTTVSGGSLFMTDTSSFGFKFARYWFNHSISGSNADYLDVSPGLSTERTIRVSSAVTMTRQLTAAVNGQVNWDDINNNWNTWPGDFDTWTYETAAFNDFSVTIYVRASDTVANLSSESWVVAQGEVVGKYVQFRADINTDYFGVTPNITALSATVEY